MYQAPTYYIRTYIEEVHERRLTPMYQVLCVWLHANRGRETEKRNVRWRGRKRKSGRPMHVNACCHKHGNEAEGSGSRVRTWTRSFAYVCVANENG